MDIGEFTAADIESVTRGVVDRKTAENWHNRDLWLTPPGAAPQRGKPRLYSLAHLFEAHIRAALVEGGGFTHSAARTAIESRLTLAAMTKERRKGRRGDAATPTFVLREEIAEEIYQLPEFKQAKTDWYWAIYFGRYERREAELESTIAFRGDQPVSTLFDPSRVVTVLHISAIVRDVLEYASRENCKSTP